MNEKAPTEYLTALDRKLRQLDAQYNDLTGEFYQDRAAIFDMRQIAEEIVNLCSWINLERVKRKHSAADR